MLVYFRVDASFQIGTGHVMRCLTLADALRERGGICHFICRAHTGHLADLICQRGHTVHLLSAGNEKAGNARWSGGPAHAQWLGSDWQTDVTQSMAEIGEAEVDWLIVDHYALDARWEQQLRMKCRNIMAIDDLADRPHDCDMLLDQNLIAGWQDRYQGLVPADCGLMLGPEYALLQSQYADLNARIPPREGPIRRILVYFGGADTDNLTGMVVSAYLSLQRTDVALDVVINPASPHADAVRQQVQGVSSITLHACLPSLAPLMAKADVAVGASGTTSWERCCLGLPSLVVTLADNQKPIAAELDRRGMIRWLGHKDQVRPTDLAQALTAILNDGLSSYWSELCSRTVDGRGAERVRAILTLDGDTPLQARPAKVTDETIIRQWTQVGAGETESGNAHFRQGLRDLDHCRVYLVETLDRIVVGQVRFERSGDTWDICRVLGPGVGESKMNNPILHSAILALRKDTVGCLRFGRIKESGASEHSHLMASQHEAGDRSKLSIAVCSDVGSWINDAVPVLALEWLAAGHDMAWAHSAAELPGGDICFYLSYGRIVDAATRASYRCNLVVHASDLPKGRGWSPASWLILLGADRIPVTLLEAVDRVDAGPIYIQDWIDLDGSELIDDWRGLLAKKTVELTRTFVDQYPQVLESKREQVGEPSTYPRRWAKDSELNPNKTIAEQINQLRIVDNDSYPAFFSHNGKEFVLKISKR